MLGGGSNSDDPFQSGLKLMKQGKYQEAILKFDEVSEKETSKINKGICLYNLQRDVEAKKIFEDLKIRNLDSYHMGLVHFYLNEYLLSLYYFSNVSDSDPNYKFVSFRVGLTYLEFLAEIKKFKDEFLLGKNKEYLDKWINEIEKLDKIEIFKVLNSVEEFLNSLAKNKKINVDELTSFNEILSCLQRYDNTKKYLEESLKRLEINSKNVEKELEQFENIFRCLERYRTISYEVLIFVKELKSDLVPLYIRNNEGKKVTNEEVVTFYEEWVPRITHSAIKFLSDGISHESPLTEFSYNKGVALSNIGKFQEAIEAFDTAVSKDPTYALALNNKGNTYVKMGKYGDAIEAYTKAIKINPGYSIAYNDRGQVYFNLKDYKKALEDFNKSIEFNPSNYKAWTNKGAVFFSQKKYGNAKEAFEKALDLNPDYVLANVYLAKLLFYLGNSTLASETINKALDLDVRNADAWRLNGQLLLEDKKYEGAIKSFCNAVQCSKGDASLVLWKAYARYLEVLDLEALSSENKEEKPQVVWSRETKSIDERVADVSKKVINSLPLKSNNSQSSKESPDKKENEGSKFKNKYYSIIRELEMYSCISCNREDITRHIVLDMLYNFFFWVKKNLKLLVLPIVKHFLIMLNHFSMIGNYSISGNVLQSINSDLEKYELTDVKSYVLYLLGCLYYKVGDYFEAKNKLEECITYSSKDVRKSATQLLDHISANYIRSPWWTWWLSSPAYRWTKRIIFTSSSFGFIVLLLFHPFIYPILFKFIYLNQFKDFFTEEHVTSNMTNNTFTEGYATSNMTNNTTTYTDTNSSAVISGNISGNDTGMAPNSSIAITENLDGTVAESFKSIQYNNSILIKSNEIFMNFDPSTVNNILYYVLVSIPIFILFSPHISKLVVKTTPVEMEMKSPKDFEFILNPHLMDDVVRKIDDVPD